MLKSRIQKPCGLGFRACSFPILPALARCFRRLIACALSLLYDAELFQGFYLLHDRLAFDPGALGYLHGSINIRLIEHENPYYSRARCIADKFTQEVLLHESHCTTMRSEEHTSELQSQFHLVCRL